MSKGCKRRPPRPDDEDGLNDSAALSASDVGIGYGVKGGGF